MKKSEEKFLEIKSFISSAPSPLREVDIEIVLLMIQQYGLMCEKEQIQGIRELHEIS